MKPDERQATTADASESSGLAVSVAIERSVGTATGFDDDLAALRRFLEFQLMRFLIGRKARGHWKMLAYVSREEVK